MTDPITDPITDIDDTPPPSKGDILRERIALAEKYLPGIDPNSMESEVTRRSIEEWRDALLQVEVTL